MPLKKHRPKPVDRVHTIALTDLRRQIAVKEKLADTPGGNALGLDDAPGSPVVGTTTNNTTALESLVFAFGVPGNYRDNENLTVRLSCLFSVARTLPSVIDVDVRLIKDGAIDANDLILTTPIDIKDVTSAANQDFVVDGDSAGDLVSAGDVFHIFVTIDNDDTGGSANGFFQLNKVSIIVPSWE